MEWIREPGIGGIVLIGKIDGKAVVTLAAAPRFAAPGQGIEGWTISKLVIANDLRGDADFTTEMIPEIVGQVKEQGWVTDDELLEYRWEDDGIHAGSLWVQIPLELRNRLLAQRVVLRDQVDQIANDRGVEVAEELTPEVAEVIAWADAEETT